MIKCEHENIQRGKDWWFCPSCSLGEREVEDGDICVTIPIFSPLHSPLRPTHRADITPHRADITGEGEKKKRVIRMPREGSMERVMNILSIHPEGIYLSHLRKHFRGREELMRTLREGEREGLLVRYEVETPALFYRRLRSLPLGFIPSRPLARILSAVVNPRVPISRTDLLNRTHMSAEDLTEYMTSLAEDGMIEVLKGKRIMYRENI